MKTFGHAEKVRKSGRSSGKLAISQLLLTLSEIFWYQRKGIALSYRMVSIFLGTVSHHEGKEKYPRIGDRPGIFC